MKQALGSAYKTGSYAPKAGDLVFLNSPERVAVIAAVDGKTIRAIEGDVNGTVANTNYTIGSSEIAGYMAMDVLKQRAGLPVVPPTEMAEADFLEHMAIDKKVIDGRLRLVLLRRMGEAVVTADYPKEVLQATLGADYRALAQLKG